MIDLPAPAADDEAAAGGPEISGEVTANKNLREPLAAEAEREIRRERMSAERETEGGQGGREREGDRAREREGERER